MLAHGDVQVHGHDEITYVSVTDPSSYPLGFGGWVKMHAVHLVTHGSHFHCSWYHFVNTGALRKGEKQQCCYMHR